MSNPLFDTKETSCAPFSTPAKTIFAYMIFTYNIYTISYTPIRIRRNRSQHAQTSHVSKKRVPNQMLKKFAMTSEWFTGATSFFLIAVGKIHSRIPSSKPQCLDSAFSQHVPKRWLGNHRLVTPKVSISPVSNLLGASETLALVGILETQLWLDKLSPLL